MTNGMDIHQHITNKIVSAIEAGAGQWQMPWHGGNGGKLPLNTESGNHYRGANVLALWCEAQLSGFTSNVWGTFRQWSGKGAQARRGAKASNVVFYRQIDIDGSARQGHVPDQRLIARATPLFNADQVEVFMQPNPLPQLLRPSRSTKSNS